jgi:hypothetical protein
MLDQTDHIDSINSPISWNELMRLYDLYTTDNVILTEANAEGKCQADHSILPPPIPTPRVNRRILSCKGKTEIFYPLDNQVYQGII